MRIRRVYAGVAALAALAMWLGMWGMSAALADEVSVAEATQEQPADEGVAAAAEPEPAEPEPAEPETAEPGLLPGAFADMPELIGDAAVLEGDAANSAAAQALPEGGSFTSDPTQVSEYDPAADSEPAGGDDPVGYGAGRATAGADSAVAAYSSSVRSGDWSYYQTTDDDGNAVYYIDEYFGSATSITLPAKLDGKQMYGVNFFDDGLPDGVTSVTFPASMKAIGASCFSYTNVSKVTFPSNSQLVSIEESAFENTPITEFTLPSHVKTLGHNAFRNALLTKLTLNAELEPMVYVGNVSSGNNFYQVTEHYNPCAGCPAVTFVVPANSKNYKVVNGALLSRDGTVLYAQMSNLGGGTYTVPSGVKILGSYSLCNNASFSGIALPSGLTTMEQYCLYNTAVQSLDMPDSVTHVQGNICEGCAQLQSVRISNDLVELGECAGWECFYNCPNLSRVTLGSSLRVIGNACFAGSAITRVDLPASLEQINYGAFGDCESLSAVTGGSGLKYVYSLAFRNAPISTFPFGGNLRFVASNAFYGCGFTPSYPSYMTPQTDGYYSYDGNLAVRGDKSYSLAYQVLDLVNQERAKQGLSALTMDKDLLDAAMQRAAETSVCFAHERPTGQQCFSASSKMTRENIASGSSTAQAVMNQWMNSSGHRANILSSDTKSIGIGCVKVSGRYFWVQCFGTSAASVAARPSDASNVVMRVPYLMSGLEDFGSTFKIYPVSDDGEYIVSAADKLKPGTSQRYGLFTFPWQGYDYVVTKIDDSCIAWSLSGSGAVLNAPTGTVKGTGAGSYKLTASVGGNTVSASISGKVAPAMYTVTFNTNGGSSVKAQTVEQGKQAKRPTDPTRTGYRFVGWCSDKALTRAYGFNSAVTANTTVYARWEAITCKVSFQSNGGSAVAAQTVKYNGKASKPADPARSGYVFKGWFTDKALTKAYNFGSAVKANVTLYAKWEKAAAHVPAKFKDVDYGDWYGNWVTRASNAGLMTGLKDDAGNYTGYFEPTRAITRAEVATVLWRIAGSPASSSWVMPDVRGHWAQAAVAWCVSQGIVTGYTDGPNSGSFLPDNQVSREELATMVYRFAKWANVKTANPPSAAFNACGDTSTVSAWARDAMRWCAAAGVITGVQGGAKPMLCPQDGANRAMAAKIFVQTNSLAASGTAPYGDEAEEPAPAEGPEEEATPEVTYGVAAGLAYTVVPDGALDERGLPYDEDAGYEELAGRYVGPGVYVTGYTGASTDLALPAQIDGVDVVAAYLAWQGDAETGASDPRGETRLTSLTFERGCGLVTLDASGNALTELRFAGDESLGGLPALRFAELSDNLFADFDPAVMPRVEELSLCNCPLSDECLSAFASWRGATGERAELTGAHAPERPSDASDAQQPAEGDDAGQAEDGSGPTAPEQPATDPAEPSDSVGPTAPAQPAADPAVDPVEPSGSEAPADPALDPAEPSDAGAAAVSDGADDTTMIAEAELSADASEPSTAATPASVEG